MLECGWNEVYFLLAEKIKMDDLWIFNPPHPHLCSPHVIFYVYIYQVEFLFESQLGLKIVILRLQLCSDVERPRG